MSAPDPFEGWTFDEEFIRGATKIEPSGEERALRARSARIGHLALLDQLAAEQRWQRRQQRRRLLTHWALPALVVVLLCGVWLASTGGPLSTIDRWAVHNVADANRPTPAKASSATPLGAPPTLERGGPHKFMFTQGGEPVTYDPCRAINVVVNDRTEPNGATGLLSEAISVIEAASGLVFDVEGITDEKPSDSRPSVQQDRYGDRWAPVLIAWSDPGESETLAADDDGSVAGYGGSSHVGTADGTRVYVTGMVTLDGPQLAAMLEAPNGRDQVRDVLIHELAHVVGLDHVNDKTQLMNPIGSAEVIGLQDGDRAGLAELGSGPCVPLL